MMMMIGSDTMINGIVTWINEKYFVVGGGVVVMVVAVVVVVVVVVMVGYGCCW